MPLQQLLSMYCSEQMHGLLQLTPWREKSPKGNHGNLQGSLKVHHPVIGYAEPVPGRISSIISRCSAPSGAVIPAQTGIHSCVIPKVVLKN